MWFHPYYCLASVLLIPPPCASWQALEAVSGISSLLLWLQRTCTCMFWSHWPSCPFGSEQETLFPCPLYDLFPLTSSAQRERSASCISACAISASCTSLCCETPVSSWLVFWKGKKKKCMKLIWQSLRLCVHLPSLPEEAVSLTVRSVRRLLGRLLSNLSVIFTSV